ncbi:MAG: hypothetical protein SVY10_13210 [Thermodesulfobacteriota bacterium]|nr:hypothetical protein [Thermodesulfobacteriota bacterium]
MIYMSEEQGMMTVAFSGELNRNNILPIRKNILEGIGPGTKKIDFHFDNVGRMDAPAMAMMVIVIKYLQDKKISSKVTGLTGECINLATVLGLPYITEVEGKMENAISHRKNNINI